MSKDFIVCFAWVALAVALVLAFAGLTGCAISPYGSAASGGANYTYSKTPDGCSITINSAREVSGAALEIGNDCSVSVTADSTSGSRAIEVINKALELAR